MPLVWNFFLSSVQVPEDVIGELLVPSLLSRMVLIDETARTHFLPNLLTPETENQGKKGETSRFLDIEQLFEAQFYLPME